MGLSSVIGGVEIGFETGASGIRDGRPTVVLVHGSGGSRESWQEQIGAMDGPVNVIALELPDHGQTPGPLLTTVADMTGFVCRAVEDWKPPAPVILAGHSLGGAITLEAGLTRPDLFGGLIPIGSGARLAVNPALFEGLEKDFAGIIGLIGKWALSKTAAPELAGKVQGMLAETPAELLINDFRACDNFDRREDVHNIKTPTLIICGEHDKMTAVELSEFLKEKIEGSRLVLIPDAGHFVMNEKPEALNAAILEFAGGL